MEKEEIKTNAWIKYEVGKNYNRQRNLYEEGRENYNYYHGRQWEGLKKPSSSQDPITLNVVKPIIKYKVNVVNQNSYKMVFNPNTYETKEQLDYLTAITKGLNQFVERMWEKSQSGKKVKRIVRTACINSEGILYLYPKGNTINTEEIDKNNIYYGNENDEDIQNQPYILVTFRKPVSEIKKLAKRYKEEGLNDLTDDDIDTITPDEDYFEQQGREFMTSEVSPMCLVVEMYERDENGIVWVSESTRTCEIRKKKSTGCQNYPFAHYVWDNEKGYARGVAEPRYLIDNQREINRTATRRAIAVKISAFPKLVVDADKIANPEALETAGSTIKLNGMRADDVSKEVAYLNPSSMSPDAYNLQQDLIQQTRDLAGASEVATGNVNPEDASGRAILLVQQAMQQPLNEQQDNFTYFIEDIGKILFEMIKVYFTEGLTLYTSEQTVNDYGELETFERPFKLSQKELENANIDIKIDISSTSIYAINNQIATLENLLTKNYITLEEFTEALPDVESNNKAVLEKIIRTRIEKQKKITEMQKEMMAYDNAVSQLLIEDGGDEVDMSNMQESGDDSNQGGRAESQNLPQV